MGSYVIPTTIVSCFKCVGKTTQSKINPMLFRDLAAEDFKYLPGTKEINPQWPGNYIEQIKALEHAGMYRAVFVSDDKEARDAMKVAKIKYTNLYPRDSSDMYSIIIDRMKLKGYSEEEINDMVENWKVYVYEMSTDDGSVTNIELDPHTIKTWPSWAMMG